MQNPNSGGGLCKCQMACWLSEGAAVGAGAGRDRFLAEGGESGESQGESHRVSRR